MTLIVSAPELYELLQQDVLVVDTRPFSDYINGHIPGAINMDLMQFHWIDTSKDGIAQFNKQSRMLLSNIGVTKKKFVVFYDDLSGPSAARGVWLLLYFRHNKVAMVDGGLSDWKAQGYPIQTKTNPFVHTNFKGMPDSKILAGYEMIKLAIKKDKTVMLDSRSRMEYDGKVIRATRAGHIPSSVNIDWADNVSESTFKDRKTLEKIYKDIPKDAEIITYCQGGYRAANSFVVLKMLGYRNVKMYLGSWGEWGNRPGLPVEKLSSRE